jgi:hypothetical protein
VGKRSAFEVDALGRYDTPAVAVVPLTSHLPVGLRYWEPCAGAGALIRALDRWAECVGASDIEPRAERIREMPGLALTGAMLDAAEAQAIITNPPWPMAGGRGEPALGLLRHFAALRPTWALLAADFAHCAYFAEVEGACAKIVSIGRVSWAGNGVGGKDNAAWYLFEPGNTRQPRFFGRRR